ncbi:MAG: hypothetical protein AAFN11_02245 [Chloroflexota bacterium]
MAVTSPSAPKTAMPEARLHEYRDAQARLPYWARSTNPIVRRHLGLYWRTVPPEVEPFIWMMAVWVVFMGIGILIPPILSITMITFLASVMIIPVALVFYGHVLVTVATDASRSMQQEFANDTFELLQASPMTLPQIVLGKVAAAIWKRMDDLVMIAQLAVVFSVPMYYAFFTAVWGDGGVISPLMAIIGMVVILVRVILEPIMIGVVSVFIGIVVPGRGRSIAAALVVGSFYFMLINLLSQLPAVRGFDTPEGPVPPNQILVILTDLVLPIVLPLLIIVGVLKLSEYILQRD